MSSVMLSRQNASRIQPLEGKLLKQVASSTQRRKKHQFARKIRHIERKIVDQIVFAAVEREFEKKIEERREYDRRRIERRKADKLRADQLEADKRSVDQRESEVRKTSAYRVLEVRAFSRVIIEKVKSDVLPQWRRDLVQAKAQHLVQAQEREKREAYWHRHGEITDILMAQATVKEDRMHSQPI